MKLEELVGLLIDCSRKAEVVFKQDKKSSEIRVEKDHKIVNFQKVVTIVVGTKK